MKPEDIAAIAGILLSLAAQYFPGFSTWYQSLPGDKKRMAMGGALALVAIGVFLAACGGYSAAIGSSVECTVNSGIQLAKNLLYALMGNQSFYLLAVRNKVKDETGSDVDPQEAIWSDTNA